MRTACRATLAAALILLFPAFNAGGQEYPNGLSVGSADPEGDAEFITLMRKRMALIRAREQRPTVALVLSGGGAKGAAEVGAIKFIEELGIPVDMVTGTSIGGLLGGLYAIGYHSEDFKELFTTQDWNRILTDAIPAKYVPYETKMYNARYVATIPFHTATDVFEEKGSTGREGDKDLNPGGIQSLISSLPSGYAYGLNIGNLISSLTVGYHDSTSFSTFPVPFVCVASEMVSKKAKNWGAGELKTAMRSTMSIPGLFAPVRINGMILSDGGSRNNFPVDLAKAMGADYIIGIELSDANPDFSQINNIGNIISQYISMLGQDAFDKNVGVPDVLIKPHIPEFGMLSFNDEAVDTMIHRGYAAAQAKEKELLRLKSRVGRSKLEDPNLRKAVNIAVTDVQIASVEYRGVNKDEAVLLARITGLKEGDMVDKAILDDAMCKLQATGAFSNLTYSLYGTEAPYALVFHCATSPTNSIGIGVRMDTEEWASILVNMGINSNKLTGSHLTLTSKLGQNFTGKLHYSYNSPGFPAVNIEASAYHRKGDIRTSGSSATYDASFWAHREALYLTDVNWTKMNLQIGVKNTGYNLNTNSVFGAMLAEYGTYTMKGNFFGAFAKGRWYSLDDYYYPSKGSSISVDCDYDIIHWGNGEFAPVLRVGIDYKGVVPMGRNFALIPEIHLRHIVNNDNEGILMFQNTAGGEIQGRYLENQAPYFATNGIQFAYDHLATATLSLRYNPYKKLFISAKGGFMHDALSYGELFTIQDTDAFIDNLAAGMEVAYNFVGGPIKLLMRWSRGNGFGAYASIGFDF